MPERKLKKKLAKKQVLKKLVKKAIPKLVESLLQRRKRLLKEQEPVREAEAKRYTLKEAETMMREKLLKEAEIGKEKVISAKEKRDAAIETLRDEYPELSERDLRKRVKNELGFDVPEYVRESAPSLEKQKEREILAKEKIDKLNKEAKIQQKEAAKLKYEGDTREYERKRKEYETTLDKRRKIEEALREKQDSAIELQERIRLAKEREAADIIAREARKTDREAAYSRDLALHAADTEAEKQRVKDTLSDIRDKQNRIKSIEKSKGYQNEGKKSKEGKKKTRELLAERNALLDDVEELKKQAVINEIPRPRPPKLEITKKMPLESDKLEQDLKHIKDLGQVLEAQKSQLPDDPLNTKPTLQLDVDENENLNRVRDEFDEFDKDAQEIPEDDEQQRLADEQLADEQLALYRRGQAQAPYTGNLTLQEKQNMGYPNISKSELDELNDPDTAAARRYELQFERIRPVDLAQAQAEPTNTAVGLGLVRKYCIHPNHIKEGKNSMLLTKEGKEHAGKLMKILPKHKADFVINWSLMNHARNKALGLKKLKRGESNLKGGGLLSWLF